MLESFLLPKSITLTLSPLNCIANSGPIAFVNPPLSFPTPPVHLDATLLFKVKSFFACGLNPALLPNPYIDSRLKILYAPPGSRLAAAYAVAV